MNTCYVVRFSLPARFFSFGLLDGLSVRLRRTYSPSPECPARKSGDEWRGEPSEALAKEGYGYGEFRIPIRMPRAGARGASLGRSPRQTQLAVPMRVRIDLLQGAELIRQFRDPLIASTNPPPKSVYCQVRAFGSFHTLLSQPCAHQPFHHPERPTGLVGGGGVQSSVGKKPDPARA